MSNEYKQNCYKSYNPENVLSFVSPSGEQELTESYKGDYFLSIIAVLLILCSYFFTLNNVR